MKNKLTKISLAFLLAVSVAGLVSCSKKNKETKFVPKLNTETKCKIEIAGRYQNFEALEAEFDRFNEFYPNVELSYTYLDNYKATIGTALVGENAPDIFMTFPWMLDKSNYGPLLDCTENFADTKKTGIELSAISQKLLYQMDDGSIPMVPVLSSANGMLVNEDLFKKEGIKIPSNYKQLLEACQKFKDAGYKSPILSHNSETLIISSLLYAAFTKDIMNDKEAIAKLNNLEPEAGEYLRPVLELLEDIKKNELIDIDECNKIKDTYQAVIMRFFEGDVPMMLASSDIVSGSKKREALSEAFTNNPFTYSFYSVPVMEDGNAVLEVPSVEFSVNKKSENLEMTNEFMRFLLRTEELNNLAMIKRLITCSTVYSFDEVYAPLGNVEHLYQLELGIMDNTYGQLRIAGYKVFRNKITVEEAIKNYGKF